jgi:hypothetical protein
MKSLDEIMIHHGTDKSSNHHGYALAYERYFEHIREHFLVLLELGFGGYQYPDRGGAGAKAWAEYFVNSQIITTDIHFKQPLNHDRIHFFQGSQTDHNFLLDVITEVERPHIIIDDGSHRVADVISSFEILFHYLWPGGIYVVEDCHTSYWPDHGYGGGWHDNTTMNYFKRLADHLNAQHNGLEARPDIEAIHFWKQQIFILKKK